MICVVCLPDETDDDGYDAEGHQDAVWDVGKVNC